MEWTTCTWCGKRIHFEGHWDGFSPILCHDCCQRSQRRVRKCWECGHFARYDYSGYCRW